jgi:hypothetical protein
MSSSPETIGTLINRRAFLAGAAAAFVPTARSARTETPDLKPVLAEIEKRHDESVRRIQDWIKQPTIAAENKGINEGRDLMTRLLREVGCNKVTTCPTDLHPGVFGILDAGADELVARVKEGGRKPMEAIIFSDLVVGEVASFGHHDWNVGTGFRS